MVEHKTVLGKEAVDLLLVRSGGLYLDATLGGGGHTEEILRRGGRVFGLDVDAEALAEASSRLKRFQGFELCRGNFRDIKNIALEHGFGSFDGVLFDLGLSAFQLEGRQRGFSFTRNGPLDMRSDKSLELTAAEVVNTFSRKDLYEILAKFGEERLSGRLADTLIQQRVRSPLKSTRDLYEVIYKLCGAENSARSVSARVFQALRIFVNSELSNLEAALPRAFELLRSGGRLAVISYHSLEDRQVKRFFRAAWSGDGALIITKRPLTPGPAERSANPRSRSAKLRALEKTTD